jgi:hypothetical protein
MAAAYVYNVLLCRTHTVHMKRNIEAESKKFMKIKNNKNAQNKRDCGSTKDKTMKSPPMPQKRKRLTKLLF